MNDDQNRDSDRRGGKGKRPGARDGGRPKAAGKPDWKMKRPRSGEGGEGAGPRKREFGRDADSPAARGGNKPGFKKRWQERDERGDARSDRNTRPGRPERAEAAGQHAAHDASKPGFKKRWQERDERGDARSDRNTRPGQRERTEAAGEDARRERGPRRFGAEAKFGEKPGFKRSHPEEKGGGAKRPAAGAKPFSRPKQEDPAPGERIAKRLARAGIASRRDAEELIAAGRIRVNGHLLTSPAVNVFPEDEIMLDGTPIPPIERTRLFLFHKPAGVVTTNRDPEGRKTVFDILPEDLPRLMTVGRLDINTEGLLLLTNDGGLARVLELPETGWLRRYRVRVHGKVDEQALRDLKDGIAVDGVFYGSVEATLDREMGSNAWLTIGLREGKNREVKNILGALGLDVTRLIRVSYGPFQLGELPEGHVQEIKGRMLRDQLGERLVEESGANFDAPIVKPFSNAPVRRERRADDERPAAARPEQPKLAPIGEGGLIKMRRRDRAGVRDEALGRLSTRKPDRGGKPFGQHGKPGEREQRREEPKHTRSANVWMAPGARPQGKKTTAEESERPAPKEPRKGRPERFGGERAAARPRPQAPRQGRDEDRSGKPYRPRGEGKGDGNGGGRGGRPGSGRGGNADRRR